jgi:hypothetical protein
VRSAGENRPGSCLAGREVARKLSRVAGETACRTRPGRCGGIGTGPLRTRKVRSRAEWSRLGRRRRVRLAGKRPSVLARVVARDRPRERPRVRSGVDAERVRAAVRLYATLTEARTAGERRRVGSPSGPRLPAPDRATASRRASGKDWAWTGRGTEASGASHAWVSHATGASGASHAWVSHATGASGASHAWASHATEASGASHAWASHVTGAHVTGVHVTTGPAGCPSAARGFIASWAREAARTSEAFSLAAVAPLAGVASGASWPGFTPPPGLCGPPPGFAARASLTVR